MKCLKGEGSACENRFLYLTRRDDSPKAGTKSYRFAIVLPCKRLSALVFKFTVFVKRCLRASGGETGLLQSHSGGRAVWRDARDSCRTIGDGYCGANVKPDPLGALSVVRGVCSDPYHRVSDEHTSLSRHAVGPVGLFRSRRRLAVIVLVICALAGLMIFAISR